MMRRFVVALALASLPATAVARNTVPDAKEMAASATATELARLLSPKSVDPRSELPHKSKLDAIKRRLTGTTLVWKGPPCDTANARCAAIASEIAERALADVEQYEARIAQYIYAQHFQNTLSPDEIMKSIAFLGTDEGKKFGASLFSVRSGEALKAVVTPTNDFHRNAPRWSMTPYQEEFFERTNGLPRVNLVAPPPISPPGAQRGKGQ